LFDTGFRTNPSNPVPRWLAAALAGTRENALAQRGATRAVLTNQGAQRWVDRGVALFDGKGKGMKVALAPEWELSDEHPLSQYGRPVLVERSRGDAYGPDDALQAYPSWGVLPAVRVVQRLAHTAHVDAQGQALVARFVGNLPAFEA